LSRKKKIILSIVLLILAIPVGFIFNAFSGNPISKYKARKEVLSYYHQKYQTDFVVYRSEYNFKIPDYYFEIGPRNNREIRFNTSRYDLTYRDAYAAALAEKRMAKEITALLLPVLAPLNFTVTVEEIGGVWRNPAFYQPTDYFDTDIELRITRNPYGFRLNWVEHGVSRDKVLNTIEQIGIRLLDCPYHIGGPKISVEFAPQQQNEFYVDISKESMEIVIEYWVGDNVHIITKKR
jgi:hypothetical protein